MSEEKQPYLTIKKVAFEENAACEVAIDFNTAEIAEKRERIKDSHKDHIQKIKEDDHFFLNSENGPIFYNSYVGSHAKVAAAEFELNDLEALHYIDTAKKLTQTHTRITDIRTWQLNKMKYDNFIDEQIQLGNPLPPRQAMNTFWKDLWFVSKWTIFLGFTLANLLLIKIPGNGHRKYERKKRAEFITKSSAKNIGEDIHDSEPSFEIVPYGKFMRIRLNADPIVILGAVPNIAGCAETEKLTEAQEPTDDSEACNDTQSENAHYAGSLDPPQPSAVPRDISEDELDTILSEVKDGKK